eukprot:6745520-Prymnesium_polylepis.1
MGERVVQSLGRIAQGSLWPQRENADDPREAFALQRRRHSIAAPCDVVEHGNHSLGRHRRPEHREGAGRRRAGCRGAKGLRKCLQRGYPKVCNEGTTYTVAEGSALIESHVS